MRATTSPLGIREAAVRLGLQTAALVVVALALVGALLYGIFVRGLTAADEQLLATTVSQASTPGQAPVGVSVIIDGPGGRVATRPLPPGLPDEAALAQVARTGGTVQSTIDLPGRAYLVRTSAVGQRVVQAAVDRQVAEEQRERLLGALLLASGAGVLLAGLLSAWLASRAVRPLAQTMAMQRRFMADASHELRTPLTLLSTRAQLLARSLRRSGPSDRLAADVDGLVADARALTEILDDLLVAADPRTTIDPSPVDVGSLAVERADGARAAAEEAGIALVVEVAGQGAPHLVRGSSAALQRAATALIDNAVDHATSRVEVRVERVGGWVRLSVADDGPGLPADLAPRIFERFASSRSGVPASGTRRRHYGIGLALVADVAAGHQGKVTAGSRDDGRPGALLTVILPAAST